jgi:hypothetical protein
MEQTQCSETSAIKHHTPEDNQKGYTRQVSPFLQATKALRESRGIALLYF